MRCAAVALFLFAASSLVAAEPQVTEVPRGDPAKWVEIKAPRGRIKRLAAEPASKWLLIDEENADLFSADGGKFGDFSGAVDGRYKLIVTGPDGGATRIVMIVGNVPPGPTPPAPVDELIEKLKAAIDKDKSPGRGELVKLLATQYATFAAKARDASLKTPRNLLTLCRETTVALIGADALVACRECVGLELQLILPGPALDTPFTDAQRDATAALFERLATILKGL